ncbi:MULTISPECIES: hypothetical protein [Bacillus subtilis group]|uniref:hypothetical protein n=1 Tax=Bacillus subtilis group TaxID=653685 RepID=UPI0021D8C42A|nr:MULTISPECIES: hypothetical protein [Bacillus subtilis group]MCY9308837.1 hypothetical protein [Bacillus inaquosorum]
MRIYRGNIGVELSLEEFSEIVLDEDKIDDLLNLIYELELDEAMNYNSDEIKEFEESLFEEAAEYQKKQNTSTDVIKMKNILAHLEKYGR